MVGSRGGRDDLTVPLGLVDIPTRQTTEPLRADLAGAAGHIAIAGAPQTGKSSFLGTLAASLIRGFTPEEAQLYAIDLGGAAWRRSPTPPTSAACSASSTATRFRAPCATSGR